MPEGLKTEVKRGKGKLEKKEKPPQWGHPHRGRPANFAGESNPASQIKGRNEKNTG